MKAALYHEASGSDRIETDTIEIPNVKEGEVLVRIKAAGVNPVDAAVSKGYMNRSEVSIPCKIGCNAYLCYCSIQHTIQ